MEKKDVIIEELLHRTFEQEKIISDLMQNVFEQGEVIKKAELLRKRHKKIGLFLTVTAAMLVIRQAKNINNKPSNPESEDNSSFEEEFNE